MGKKSKRNRPPSVATTTSPLSTVTKQSEITQFSYSGPIPPPDALKAYDGLLPGLADRIVAMAESEVKHRHAIEDRVIKAETDERKRGQDYSIVATIFSLSIAAFGAYLHEPTFAGIVGGATVVGLVSAFLYNKRSQRNEEQQSPEVSSKIARK